jgi:hypothetical protein
MDRLGRGYSFEALRAKILFAEGAFKKQIIRPKFARRREEPAAGAFTVGYMSFGGEAPKRSNQHVEIEREVNFGVDISTLTRLIESGEI